MHALGECDISQHPSLPAAWEPMSMADSMQAFLTCVPEAAWFDAVLLVAARIDKESSDFWA